MTEEEFSRVCSCLEGLVPLLGYLLKIPKLRRVRKGRTYQKQVHTSVLARFASEIERVVQDNLVAGPSCLQCLGRIHQNTIKETFTGAFSLCEEKEMAVAGTVETSPPCLEPLGKIEQEQRQTSAVSLCVGNGESSSRHLWWQGRIPV